MAKKPRKPAAKKPARRTSTIPTASAEPVRRSLVVRIGSSRPDVDAMDAGLDLLATIELALSSREAFSDRDEATALRGAVLQAMRLLRPVREAINELRA